MEKTYESKYHRVEETNWWFVSRRDFIIGLISRLNLNKNSHILEVGCASGLLLDLLKQKGYDNCYGIDISSDAIDSCNRRGVDNVKVMDATQIKFKDYSFDLIIASDILEHIKNDDSALKEWHRLLKPDGKLIVFVPAFQFLWTSHDIVNKHYRRYDKASLTKQLEESKFNLQRVSYWNFILFFPAFFFRTLKRLVFDKNNRPSDDVYELNFLINGILITLLRIENLFLKFLDFPVGVSVFAVCRK
jgi:SAM-dependent methyltransferase